MTTMWIDCDVYDFNPTATIGTHGYLVRTLNTSNGVESHSLRERPLRTNQSHEPRLTGWCGETDNRSRYAVGVWKIVQVNKARDRVRIVRLHGADLACFLADDGHPDLMPAALAKVWEQGTLDGDEAVCDLYNSEGAETVVASSVSWGDAAKAKGTHKAAGVSDEMAPIYYAAYDRGAKDRVAEMRNDHAA